ncbi:MAG: magnesium transporter CorA family protein [Patescibacteria group bacterium]
MIEIYKRTLRDEKLQKIEKVEVGSWVFITDPTVEEIELLEKNYQLDKGHITDALDEYETPRLEIEKNDLYIFLRIPYFENKAIYTIPALFILGESNIFTITKEKKELFNDFLSGKIDVFTTQKTKLLVSFLLKLNGMYRSYLNLINKNIRIKQHNLGKIKDQDIVEFVEWERILNDFIVTLVPTSNIYNTLLTRQYLEVFKEDKDLVEDLTLGINENLDICKTNLKMIVNIREAYSTIMTNSLNKAIKFLTAITIIVAFPTFIASVFGMNFILPFQNNPHAFSMTMGFSVISSALILLYFNKKGWL